jgi:putative membrane protein
MKTHSKIKLIILASLPLLAFQNCNRDKDKNDEMNSTDGEFMKMVSMGNHAEIEAGKLAASKATDSSVKSFGRSMMTEHQTAQDELEVLAANKKTEIPAGPDAAHVAMVAQMKNMSGRQFDSAYIHSQVSDHQKVLELFMNEQNNGKDQDVKNYADKFIMHIRMHLNRADSTSKRF